jgi:DNA-3-methyladenine glycosylase I
MLTTSHRRQHHAYEKSPNHMKNIDRKLQAAMSHAAGSKYMQRIYPLGIQRSSSNLTLSSLSLSQNSNDSSLSSSNSSWEPKVPLLYGGTFSPWGDVLVSLERRREDDKVSDHDVEGGEEELDCNEPGSLHRCSWITKNSGKKCLLLPMFLCLSSCICFTHEHDVTPSWTASSKTNII